MTFPGVSVTEWTIRCCEKFSMGWTGVMKIAYFHADPKFQEPSHVCSPLLFVLLFRVERFGVGGIAEVFMERLSEKIHVPFDPGIAPRGHEFELWGVGARHRDGEEGFVVEFMVRGQGSLEITPPDPRVFIPRFKPHVSVHEFAPGGFRGQ